MQPEISLKSKDSHFDIATIMLPIIYGPNQYYSGCIKPEHLCFGYIYCFISPQSKSSDPIPQNMFWSCINESEVAEAHIHAYTDCRAGGKRFFICKSNFTYQQFMDDLWSKFLESVTACPLVTLALGQSHQIYTLLIHQSLRRPWGSNIRNLNRRWSTLHAPFWLYYYYYYYFQFIVYVEP